MNEILTRERPYKELSDKGFSNEAIFSRICEGNLQVSRQSLGEDDFADKINGIIEECIQFDPLARPTCTTIRVNIQPLINWHLLI